MGGLASAVVGSVLSPIAAAGLHLNRSALGGLWVSTGCLTLWSVLSCGGHSVFVSLDCFLG